jgi:hypothetical protein
MMNRFQNILAVLVPEFSLLKRLAMLDSDRRLQLLAGQTPKS